MRRRWPVCCSELGYREWVGIHVRGRTIWMRTRHPTRISVKLIRGELCWLLVREGGRFVVGLAVLEAVEEHSHEAVEQVPLCCDVAVAGFSAAVVVGLAPGDLVRETKVQT